MNKRINRPKKALKLRGSNAAITGGFGSIGKAACISMLERGIASLGILDIRENKSLLEALRRRYPEKQIYYQPIDVTNRYSVAEAFNVVGDKVKNLDVFINSSGVLCDGCPEKTIGVNLLGTVYTTLAAMERMGRHNGGKGGTIVNIASVLGLVPCNAFAIYSSSKHGQVGFTRSLADDFYFKRTGVKLMLVCPGMTNTDLTQDPEGSTTFPYAAILGRHLVTAESQSAEICAENMVRAMEKNKNGSVWILDVGKYYEVRPVQYWIPVYNESNNSPDGVKNVN
ncbi:unnamed protein product [Hermetia illucens]|uniref:Alcohol dehydrogenase n=2 Tax=Hermetia illucens TaxID=343691 RepID=A0A7R8UMH6_HERIL|nr:unnamed protein product [Hermetia illucens]